MSRFRRLKERKRKNRIKVTSYGLALALAVGSAQGLGTYALFTDTEKVSSDIALSTGDVNVEITNGAEGFHKTELQPGDTITYTFTVTNHGTLRQNLTLQLDTNKIPSELKDIIPYIDYNVKFEDNTTLVGIDGTPIYGLENGIVGKVINAQNNSLFVLNPGESMNLTAEVVILKNMPNETQVKLQDKVIPLDFKVQSTQINGSGTLMNTGFYDICIQKNTLMIGALILQSGGAIKVTPADGINDTGKNSTVSVEFNDGSKNGVRYMGLSAIIDILDGGLSNKLDLWEKTIQVVGKSGFFKDATIYRQSPGIKMDIPIERDAIGSEFNSGHYVDIQLDYGNGVYRVYRIDFRGIGNPTGNRLAQAKVSDVTKEYPTMSQGDIISSESEIIEPSKEEIEKPSEPEVVEPPKEEIEKPSEPEVVEPPKEEIEKPSEPEVIEPPKEEITEIPKQPEVIEPPKENEEIQE